MYIVFSVFRKVWPVINVFLTLRPIVSAQKRGPQVPEAHGLAEWVKNKFLVHARQLASLFRWLVAYEWNQWHILRSGRDAVFRDKNQRKQVWDWSTPTKNRPYDSSQWEATRAVTLLSQDFLPPDLGFPGSTSYSSRAPWSWTCHHK